MTRKDYEKIANILNKGIRPVQADAWFNSLLDNLCDMFQADNPRFDSERFKIVSKRSPVQTIIGL